MNASGYNRIALYNIVYNINFGLSFHRPV